MRARCVFIFLVLLVGIFLSFGVSAVEISLVKLEYSDSTVFAIFNVSEDVSFCGLVLGDSSSAEIVQANASRIDSSKLNKISYLGLPFGEYSAKARCLSNSKIASDSNTILFKIDESGLNLMDSLSESNSSSQLSSYVDELAQKEYQTLDARKSKFEKSSLFFIFLFVVALVLLILLLYILYNRRKNKFLSVSAVSAGGKLILFFLLVGIFLVSGVNAVLIDTDGDGYKEIHNCAELQSVSDTDITLTYNYELFNDINCAGTNFRPIGVLSTGGYTAFSGKFNGNGFVIGNLYIYRPNELWVALFRGVSGVGAGGIIQNLGLVNISVTGRSSSATLAGYFEIANISNCFAIGNVTAIGGETGSSGLVGSSSPDRDYVINSYAVVRISSTNNYDGGLVGSPICNPGCPLGTKNASVISSYWDRDVSTLTTNYFGGDGKTTAQMKNPSTFVGWDSSVWNLTAGFYPSLKAVPQFSTCTSCSTWGVCSGGIKTCSTPSPAGCVGTIASQSCTDAVCGQNNASISSSAWPSTTSISFCSSGTAPASTPTFPSTVGASVSWNCTGINGGANKTCVAVRAVGACTSCSTWGACSGGTRSCQTKSPAGCTGDIASQSCTDAVCGQNNATSYNGGWFSASDGYFCSSGTAPSPYPAYPTTYGALASWNCTGINGGANKTCTALRINDPACGVASYGTFQVPAGYAGDCITFLSEINVSKMCSTGFTYNTGSFGQQCSCGGFGCYSSWFCTKDGNNHGCYFYFSPNSLCSSTCSASQVGTKQCVGSGYQTCNDMGSSCYKWGAVTSCGATSCNVSKHLVGSCTNGCTSGSCTPCTPTCSCALGYTDLDNNLTNGCEDSSIISTLNWSDLNGGEITYADVNDTVLLSFGNTSGTINYRINFSGTNNAVYSGTTNKNFTYWKANSSGNFTFSFTKNNWVTQNVSNNLTVSTSSANTVPIVSNFYPSTESRFAINNFVWFNRTSGDADDLLNLTLDFKDGSIDYYENYSFLEKSFNSSLGNMKHNFTSAGSYLVELSAWEFDRSQKVTNYTNVHIFKEGINVIPIITTPENGFVYLSGENANLYVTFNASQTYVVNCSSSMNSPNFTTEDGQLKCRYLHAPGVLVKQDLPSHKLFFNWSMGDGTYRSGYWNSTEYYGSVEFIHRYPAPDRYTASVTVYYEEVIL